MNRNSRPATDSMRFIPAGAELSSGSEFGSDDYDYDDDDVYQTPTGPSRNTSAPIMGSHYAVPTAVAVSALPAASTLPPQLMEDYRMAAMHGSLSTLKSLIVNGLDVGAVMKTGWTGLMYACNFGHPEVVELLLHEGADVNYDHEEFTALLATCSSSKNLEDKLLKCVEYLIKHGANVNASEKNGVTSLMYAAREGYLKIIQLLLENEVNVNTVDNRQWAAMHYAIHRSQIDVVRMLLRANTNIVDMESIVDFAKEREAKVIVQILEHYVKNKNILENAELCQTETKQCDSTLAGMTTTLLNVKPKFSTYVFGDLEMFLAGLDLRDLIPVFHAHELKMKDLLQLTEEDLLKIGIDKLGWRKRILEGILTVHRTEWKESSLPNITDKEQFSCPEAVCMMANIENHTNYMQATIAYLLQKIQNNPQILEMGQEANDVRTLLKRTLETEKAGRVFLTEVVNLKQHLNKVESNWEYSPSHWIEVKSPKRSLIELRKLLRNPTIYIPAVLLAAFIGYSKVIKM